MKIKIIISDENDDELIKSSYVDLVDYLKVKDYHGINLVAEITDSLIKELENEKK